MTLPDPGRRSRASFRRLMAWTISTAVIVMAVAILWLMSQGPISLHMLVATALGTGGAVLMAGLLMGLIFLSDRSGHDDRAGGGRRD